MMRSQEKGGFAKNSFSEHYKAVRQCQTNLWDFAGQLCGPDQDSSAALLTLYQI